MNHQRRGVLQAADGGGAVYLIAKGSIAITGSVNASGASGDGGGNSDNGGGGGGAGVIKVHGTLNGVTSPPPS